VLIPLPGCCQVLRATRQRNNTTENAAGKGSTIPAARCRGDTAVMRQTYRLAPGGGLI